MDMALHRRGAFRHALVNRRSRRGVFSMRGLCATLLLVETYVALYYGAVSSDSILLVFNDGVTACEAARFDDLCSPAATRIDLLQQHASLADFLHRSGGNATTKCSGASCAVVPIAPTADDAPQQQPQQQQQPLWPMSAQSRRIYESHKLTRCDPVQGFDRVNWQSLGADQIALAAGLSTLRWGTYAVLVAALVLTWGRLRSTEQRTPSPTPFNFRLVLHALLLSAFPKIAGSITTVVWPYNHLFFRALDAIVLTVRESPAAGGRLDCCYYLYRRAGGRLDYS